jgi:hypothetical protein
LIAAGFAAVSLLLILQRGLLVMPWSAYLPAILLALGFVVLRQFSATMPALKLDEEAFVYPWLLVCFVLALSVSVSRLTHLDQKSRNQALVLLAGIALSSVLGLAWGLTTLLYASACKPGVDGVFCALARYNHWLHQLPALVIAFFFALALTYPGEVDAAKLFRRTTLYALLAGLVIFGFAMLEHVLDDLLGNILPNDTPRVIAAGAVGMAVHPVKRRLEEAIDVLLKKLLT